MTRLNKFEENPLNRLSPNQIEVRLGLLIQLYFHRRSECLAKSIAAAIGDLLAHPDFDVPFEQRCAFRHLEMHWRCLAWLGNHAKTTDTSIDLVDTVTGQ